MAQVSGTVRSFVRWNHRISKRIRPRFPHARRHCLPLFDQRVGCYANRSAGTVIVDIGAGSHCFYRQYLDDDKGARIIGLDISQEEMDQNPDLDERIVCDATKTLPLPDCSADLVVSRSVLEHLPDVEAFVAESSRVLKPGGYSIHVFPSKQAPFSVINRMIPNRVARTILRTLRPGQEGMLGFPAYYDHCTISDMERVFTQSGVEVVETDVSYYQAEYFGFFVPLYVANLVYEAALDKLNLRDLGATALIVARKPEATTV